MRSRTALLLLIAVCLSTAAQAQEQAGYWLQTREAAGPIPSAFSDLVFKYLGASGHPSLKRQDIDADKLRETLLPFAGMKTAPEVVIQCSLAEYLKLLKDPDTKALLTDLHLELLNARLFSYPFYLLRERDRGFQPENGSADIAWITLPRDGIHPVEDADLLTMLSEALGRPKSSLKIVRERGAYPAARKLHEGEYRLIGIYEDEPSALLDEFRVNWEEELKADPVEFFPFDPKRVSGQLIPVVPGRFGYLFFSYSGSPFGNDVPPSRPMLAIAQEMNHPFPVLLSNARVSESPQRLSEALSFAYFLMPSAEAVRSIPEAQRRAIVQMYLLNSYLEDPESRYKSLGLLGSLLMNREGAGEKAQREIYAEKCDLFQHRLRLSETTADQILKWLGMEAPAVGKRELFSSDVSRLYEDALKQIDQGLRESGAARTLLLEKARAGLVAALMQGSRPKNVQGSRGLWSVADYNPYYQLARVALYLDLERGKR